ncbi:MAG: SpoIIE family protein phosphatase [Candidatus Riflebacteria bacterium]|nr:SpoIIE family protein phosphatase [Candidatus Riflebacteria bacterium]
MTDSPEKNIESDKAASVKTSSAGRTDSSGEIKSGPTLWTKIRRQLVNTLFSTGDNILRHFLALTTRLARLIAPLFGLKRPSTHERLNWVLFIIIWSLSLGILLAGHPDGILYKIAILYQFVALVISMRKLLAYRGELRFLREFHHLSQALDDLRLLDTEHPFVRILEAVTRIVGFNRAMLLRPNASGNELHVVSGFGLDPDALDGLSIPRENGLSLVWKVVKTGEPLVVNDPITQPEIFRQIPALDRARAVALAPIVRGGIPLGVLVVDRLEENTPITDDEMLQLQVLADQIAISLQNHAFNAELAYKAELLTTQSARLHQELDLAKLVQEGWLPRTAPDWDKLSTAAFIRSARFIGGDFYGWLDACSAGRRNDRCGKTSCKGCPYRRQGVLIGDVCGKGIPAALVMSVVNSLFREKVSRLDDPAALMNEVNDSLKTYLGAESRFFSSAFLGFHSPSENVFRFANAGHDFPIMQHKSKGTIEPLPSTGTLLGIFRESRFTTKEIKVETGDRIFFYTDGLLDFFEQQRGMEDGLEYLKTFLTDNTALNATSFIARIQEMIDASTEEACDDVTALIIVVE